MKTTSDITLSEQTIAQALEHCASEPVHIPGAVQPFGCLVCVDASTGRIDYVSNNCSELLGLGAEALLGQQFRDVFGREISHALNNASGSGRFAEQSSALGVFEFGEKELELSAFASGTVYVVQFEVKQTPDLGGGDELNTLSFLIREIQACEDQKALLDLTTRLLRHLTAYDRVMIYKFDQAFSGKIIAEARQRTMEPFLGLHFPHWDIPAQARAMMKKTPLRFIQDVEHAAVPLLAAHMTLPALDISLAECRGVSPVHMEYLRNMGVASTLTLSIVVDDRLWGIVSFHHRQPRVPALKTRELLCAFQEIFCSKLTVLRKQAQLDLARRIDSLKDDTLGAIEAADSTMELATAGPALLEAMQSDGLAVMTGSLVKKHGQIPEQSVLDHLAELAHKKGAQPTLIESISAEHPALVSGSNGIAGALVVADGPGRTLFLFRREIATSVSWAGNPEKKIELSSGGARLRPRGSFSLYLEEVRGKSQSWTEDDLFIAERVWTLINSAERQELRSRLEKQKDLMISELNHRVRNILSLVRSVSRQARRHNSSLDSYSESIERRIQALAAAHDLASGDMRSSIAMAELLDIELDPYSKDNQISVSHHGAYLRADVAPIFSLVVHELATNAAKYGSLSAERGRLDIQVREVQGGISLAWRESGGPKVVPPKEYGFGSTLIDKAVPYEMGGTADLRFAPTGVEADFFLPNEILDAEPEQPNTSARGRPLSEGHLPVRTFDPTELKGLFLIVEDNYTIAKDMLDQLVDAGVEDIETCSNVTDALEVLDHETPAFAILDVNLGPGKTSEPIALRLLQDKVPFFFATGYGDKADLHPDLAHVRCLTKPASTRDILEVMNFLLNKTTR